MPAPRTDGRPGASDWYGDAERRIARALSSPAGGGPQARPIGRTAGRTLGVTLDRRGRATSARVHPAFRLRTPEQRPALRTALGPPAWALRRTLTIQSPTAAAPEQADASTASARLDQVEPPPPDPLRPGFADAPPRRRAGPAPIERVLRLVRRLRGQPPEPRARSVPRRGPSAPRGEPSRTREPSDPSTVNRAGSPPARVSTPEIAPATEVVKRAPLAEERAAEPSPPAQQQPPRELAPQPPSSAVREVEPDPASAAPLPAREAPPRETAAPAARFDVAPEVSSVREEPSLAPEAAASPSPSRRLTTPDRGPLRLVARLVSRFRPTPMRRDRAESRGRTPSSAGGG